jgi:hypothetical protein
MDIFKNNYDAIILINYDKGIRNKNWNKFLKNKKTFVFDLRSSLKIGKKIKVLGRNF